MSCNKLCKMNEKQCQYCKKTYIVSDEFWRAKRASFNEYVVGYLVKNKSNGAVAGILTSASQYYELAFVDESTLEIYK